MLVARRWHSALLLAALSGFLFFYGLGAGNLYRTESLRALVASEMLRAGDWIVPTQHGEPLFTKPPLAYDAIALASWPFGAVSTWTARLPSAVAATLTVFLFWWYFGRVLGPRAGFIAGMILPLSAMWLDKVPTAEIDPLLVLWVTASILFFLRGLEPNAGPGWWLASLLCVAAGFLTKWTAPVFFYLTVVLLLWHRGELRLLFGKRHVIALSLAVAVCLGWVLLAVAQAGWGVFWETVSREALQRLSPAHSLEARRVLAQGRDPGLYPWQEVLAHPFLVFAANLPWSAIALWTLRPGFAKRWDDRGRLLLLGMHCWTWPNLVFWSVIPEHAMRQSFPFFPGIAGLAAMAWAAWLGADCRTGTLARPDGQECPSYKKGIGPGRVLAGFLVLWLVAKVVFVEVVIPGRFHEGNPHALGEALAEVIPAGKPLYLLSPKDDAILFSFGRCRPGGKPATRKVSDPAQVLSISEPVYCILDDREWKEWSRAWSAEVVRRFSDAPHEPLVLVRLTPSSLPEVASR